MVDIKINIIGKVLKGDGVGSFIKILDDRENTGGFLIIFSQDRSFTQVFDGWVEDYKNLKQFFEESDWDIDWDINEQA